MHDGRLLLLLIAIGVLVHYGKHYLAIAFVRDCWQRHRLATAVVSFVVLYAFVPAVASALIFPLCAICALVYMTRTR